MKFSYYQGTMTSKQQIRKLENNYNCVKKDPVWYYVEIIRPEFFKSFIGRSMVLEAVVVVVCR